ncbi:hypothetical protein [Methylocystis echinoides]|jgi:hypothetical protein|uniref:hypothetical protein n=1 Tax=Methylocystis echinoides TaxID=29468 RepID=UPI003417B23B
MTENWQYQIRFRLSEEQAEAARSRTDGPAFKPIADVLALQNAMARSQYDAFAGYVSEAERNGVEQYPLYKWTKATIEDPIKRAKHACSFAVLVGGAEVYDKPVADALEAALRPLLEQGVITGLSRHDTNPANNPQPPAKFR